MKLGKEEMKFVLDKLFPVHGRTSCSDSCMSNGHWVSDDGELKHARCSRCSAYELLTGKWDYILREKKYDVLFSGVEPYKYK